MNIKKILILLAVMLLFFFIRPKEPVPIEELYQRYTSSTQIGDLCEIRVTSLLMIGEMSTSIGTSSLSVATYYIAVCEGSPSCVVSFSSAISDYDERSAYVIGSENYDPNVTEPLVIRGVLASVPTFGVKFQYSTQGGFSADYSGADNNMTNQLLQGYQMVDTSHDAPQPMPGAKLLRVVFLLISVAAGLLISWEFLCFGYQKLFPKEEPVFIPSDPAQEPVPEGGWRCTCGIPHEAYVSSCACGRTKQQAKAAVEQTKSV